MIRTKHKAKEDLDRFLQLREDALTSIRLCERTISQKKAEIELLTQYIKICEDTINDNS